MKRFILHFFNNWNGLGILLITVFQLLFLDCINGQSKRPALKIPMGHQKAIRSVSISADGKWVVTGSADNTFIIWDAKTGYEIRRINTGAPVQQVLLSPDASYLVTATGQNNSENSAEKLSFKKWDVKTGKLLTVFPFTGSPDMKFAVTTGDLLVANYSEDLNRRQEYRPADITDPAQLRKLMIEKMKKAMPGMKLDSTGTEIGEIGFDSNEKKIEENNEMDDSKRPDSMSMEEYMKLIRIKMESRSKEVMEMRSKQTESLYTKNYTLLDSKNFKPVADLSKLFETAYFTTYQNAEFILSVTSRRKGSVKLWELSKLLSALKENKEPLPQKSFPHNIRLRQFTASRMLGFFATDSGRFVKLWQIEKQEPLVTLKAQGERISEIEFSQDGNTLFVYSTTMSFNTFIKYIETWNTTSLKQLSSTKLPSYYSAGKINLSPSGDYLTITNNNGLKKINKNGETIGEFKAHSVSPTYYGFAENGQQVYLNYSGPRNMEQIMGFIKADPEISAKLDEGFRISAESAADAEIYQKQLKLSKTERDKLVEEKFESLRQLTGDSKNYKGHNLHWDLIRGGASFQKPDSFAIRNDSISPDKNYILTNEYIESGNKDNTTITPETIYRVAQADTSERGKKRAALYAPSGAMGKDLSTDRSHGPVTLLINKKTRDTISLMRIDSLDWIMVLKNGYYMTSKNGAKVLSYVSGMQVLPFDQFDTKYNRPDLVLKAIGLASPAVIEAYRNAYEKRIKKLDIDTTQFKEEFEVPESDFGNRDKINDEQKTSNLNLVITARDNKTNLNRYNVWVNEVPVFGKNGKSIKDARSKTLNTNVEITLSQGINRIETSVMNSNGVESYRTPLIVKYNPVQPKQKRYILWGWVLIALRILHITFNIAKKIFVTCLRN
ncbi:MAG: WD40 repeat domain-containing protein [Bacteroidota bacterium]